MEQKVIPQSIRGLGNVCDNFSENDFIKINADTTLQDNVVIDEISLKCFRVQMKGEELNLTVSGASSLRYGVSTNYTVIVRKRANNQLVSNVTIGLYVNEVLVASGVCNYGSATISFTPYVFGDVVLEFKILPQQGYAMAKTTKNVTISVGTVITVFSPYIVFPNNTKGSAFGAWVTSEDGSVIIPTTLSLNYNGQVFELDSRTSRNDDSLLAIENIPSGSNVTISYSGEGIYQASSVSFKSGYSGQLGSAKPPVLPEVTVTDPNSYVHL